MGEAVGPSLPVGATRKPKRRASAAEVALLEIRSRLARVGGRWRFAEFLERLFFWTAVLAGVVLAVATVELALRPGLWLRLPLFACLVGTAAAALARVVSPLFMNIPDVAVARRVERAFPEIGNALVNALQLGSDERVPSRALASAAIVQSREQVRGVRMRGAVTYRRAGRLAGWAGGTAAALALAFFFYGGPLASALLQVLAPFSFVPVQGGVRIVSVRPGDATVRAGERVAVEVKVEASTGAPPEGRLFWRLAGGDEVDEPLTPSDKTRYVSALTATADTAYRVEVGRTQSRVFKLRVIERPAIERVDLNVHYPPWANREDESIENALDERLDVRAPEGAIVTWTVRTNRPVGSAKIEIAGEGAETVALEASVDRKAATGSVRLAEPGERRYAIRVADEGSSADDAPVWHLLATLEDAPPKVTFVAPAKKIELAPGARVSLVVRATDDYGLNHVEVRYRRNKEGAERPLRAWGKDELAERADTALTHGWTLERGRFEAGDIVTYRAAARDRVAGRETTSGEWQIRVIDPKEKMKQAVSALEAIMKAVEKLAALQEDARARSRKTAAREGADWRKIVAAQATIRSKTVAAIKASLEREGADADVAVVRAVLRKLAEGEMARAIVQCERLAGAAPEADSKALEGSQTAILEQLRRILGILPKAIENAKKEALADDDPSDLPDAAAEKLRDLAEQLKEFMDEQRKVISSTEDLAKIPVEDFTEEDKAKQEALAAIEEKWEKFMREAATDLSKLPTQDFSSEQLLEELIETYSEVEMAKGALTEKSAEIAVPVEQAGLEMAEELTTHLEKWLSDKPDRQQWSMEEPLGEAETPSAELPSELEDIIGELMEGEEDIFEEMEDASSSWMDSLDKGAGWDALDGPISNMSAQGVTGNQLPNSSEIGGRSGEGRTGKASGEMVEDTATGKGGRQTPTRLTPDAFLGGEVKDTSKDPAGGATGGGKLSGGGGEGLEGPAPPELEREMERLKGAQASLRNKAERIGMELRARNFPEADIEVTMQHLRSLEADLKDGRYANIAHRRNVLLDGLQRTREFVEGTARVELDRSRGPEGFDEAVGSARDEVDPAGYEDLLRAYRDAIRSGGAE